MTIQGEDTARGSRRWPPADDRARVLLVGDTHLGFDQPVRPRVARRRRGPDFFRCFREALAPARTGQVDLVVHGGDLLYRRRVPATLVDRALEPLREVAAARVPVVLVPGNHERSVIPYRLLAEHPHVHVFDRPSTITLEVRGLTLALSGFPYHRTGVRDQLGELLEMAGWEERRADVRLLCMHHIVEGATVGVPPHTFRDGVDVIRGPEIPAGLAAVLSGHIHRHQVLTRDLAGRPLGAPVFYPGSVERTSFAERDELKGYLILEVGATGAPGGEVLRWRFHELPARPMVDLELQVNGLEPEQLERLLRRHLAALPPDAVVRLRPRGPVVPASAALLRAGHLRTLAPSTMNVSLAVTRAESPWPRQAQR